MQAHYNGLLIALNLAGKQAGKPANKPANKPARQPTSKQAVPWSIQSELLIK